MEDSRIHALWRLGAIAGAAVVLVLAGWVVAARTLGLDVVSVSRWAGVCAMTVLIATVLTPLFIGEGGEKRVKGFVVFWFVISLTFDVVWEIPLVTIPAISAAEVGIENLHWGIFWWAYTLSDSLYTEMTPLVVSAEIWWFLGNLFGAWGLVTLYRGKESKAFLLLGLCGALQAYNATLYIGMSGIVDHFETIPADWKAHALFWGLNGFWGLAAGLASLLSFRRVLAGLEERRTENRRATASAMPESSPAS